MKLFILLPLLLTAVLSETKVNLGNIDKDHHRGELRVPRKLSPETLRTEESKYSTKTETLLPTQSQQQQQQQQHQQVYHGPTSAPQELGNQVGDYAELQSYESFKYSQPQSQDYSEEKYPENEDTSAYQQQSSVTSSSGDQQQQYYIQEGRSHSQNDYNTLKQQQQQRQQYHHQQQPQQQQQLYQQEVLVGNQLQSVQQKAAAQKYVDGNDDKNTYYVNIPMNQLLAYYQNYGIVQTKHKNAEQQVSMPIYMPLLTQNQVYSPTKVTYQPEVQYVPEYPKHTQAVFAKSSRSGSSIHAAPAATSSSPVHQLPVANQHEYTPSIENQAYTPNAYQPEKYQQYYIEQSQQQQLQQQHQQQQPQHQQQFVYETPLNDIYNSGNTGYVQDNSLYEQQQQHQQQNYYVPAALAEQLMQQILHQAGIQSSADVAQQLVKQPEIQEALHQEYSPPQYQAQKFRASQEVTHLVPISNENEGFSTKPIYSSVSSQPKTLLDSYIPSHVIAAQDANRYRERPIKLESGFLPSKINFIRTYKKRKSE